MSAKLAHLLIKEKIAYKKCFSLVDIDGTNPDNDVSEYPT